MSSQFHGCILSLSLSLPLSPSPSPSLSRAAMQRLLRYMLALLSLSVVLAARLAAPAVVGACPEACRCSRKTSQERSEVNCHKKGLRAFPAELPPDAWVLKLGMCSPSLASLTAPT